MKLFDEPTRLRPYSSKWITYKQKLESYLKERAVPKGEEGWNIISMSGKPAGGKFCLPNNAATWENLCAAGLVLGKECLFTSFVQIIPSVAFFTLDIDIKRDGPDHLFFRFTKEGGLHDRCVMSFILRTLGKTMERSGYARSRLNATVLSAHGQVGAGKFKTSWRVYFYDLPLTRRDSARLTEYLKRECLREFGSRMCDFDKAIDSNFGRENTGTRLPHSYKVTRSFCSACQALRKLRTSLPKNSKTCSFGNKCGLLTSPRPFVPSMWLRPSLESRGWVEQKPVSWKWFMRRCSVVPFHTLFEGDRFEPIALALPDESCGPLVAPCKATKKCSGLGVKRGGGSTTSTGGNPAKRRKTGRERIEMPWSAPSNWNQVWTEKASGGTVSDKLAAGRCIEWCLVPFLGGDVRILPHKLSVETSQKDGRSYTRIEGWTEGKTAFCPMNDYQVHSKGSRLVFSVYASGKIIVRCLMPRCSARGFACGKIEDGGIRQWVKSFIQYHKHGSLS